MHHKGEGCPINKKHIEEGGEGGGNIVSEIIN